MTEKVSNNLQNTDDLSGVELISGGGFYCYNGNQGSARTVGNYSSTNNQNAGATNIQVRMAFNTNDTTNYQLNYTIDGESHVFIFTPETKIFAQQCSFNDFSCQLTVPAGGGNYDTYCSISIYKV